MDKFHSIFSISLLISCVFHSLILSSFSTNARDNSPTTQKKGSVNITIRTNSPEPIKKNLMRKSFKKNQNKNVASQDTGQIDIGKSYIRPIYPNKARRLGLEGKVIAIVNINEFGKIISSKILKSSGHQILDKEALRAINNTTFSNTKTVEQKISINFQLNN